MNSSVSKRPPPVKQRRHWRYFLQFSLRSLLILTTLCAIGCWWFLQPKVHEEELPGKYLTLRRHTRPARQDDMPAGYYGKQDPTGITVNEGLWHLHDEHGNLVVSGQTLANRPHGHLTIYHANGRLAADGRMSHGLRTGIWRTWDDAGRKRSEVTYARVKQIVGPAGPAVIQPASPAAIQQAGPLVKIIPRSHLGGRMGMGGMGIKNGLPDDQIHLPDISERQGPARTWHHSGQLQSAGSYERDFRDGHWTFYDAQGRQLESGHYRRGLREGPWSIRDAATSQLQTIEFFADRPRAEFDRLITELKTEIASDDLDRQIIAMHRLDDLGELAVPLLANLLNDVNDDIQLMGLRRLEALSRIAESENEPLTQFSTEIAIATAERFIESPDHRTAGIARYWLYRLVPARREALYEPLAASVRASRNAAWQEEVLRTLAATHGLRGQATFAALAHAASDLPWPEHAFMAGGCGLSTRPTHPFLDLAQKCEGIEILLTSAMESPDPKVRRFAIEVIDQLAIRGPFESKNETKGATEMHHQIPAAYQQLIEKAKSDPDNAIREAAENAGKRTLFTPVVG